MPSAAFSFPASRPRRAAIGFDGGLRRLEERRLRAYVVLEGGGLGKGKHRRQWDGHQGRGAEERCGDQLLDGHCRHPVF
jgi:hypothetical protein